MPLIGSVDSASEGQVGFDDIRLPPLLRVGELVETVPGMVATQHSGTGKANQYFLRGFNLDHGTDFAASLDGVPLNLRTHGHGQGYLDMNFIIPELVETTWYRKGPYAIAVGDFSSAGSVDFRYADRLDETILELEAGSHAYRRGLIAGTVDTAAGALTSAFDLTHYDGPWQKDENSMQAKGYLGLATDIAGVPARLHLHLFDSEWDATDQIPERAVATGLISRLGNLDPDLGGNANRYGLSAEFAFSSWELTAYATRSTLELHSNFTYLLDNPSDGDEFTQEDQRYVYGLVAKGELQLAADVLTLEWGSDVRHDDISRLALYPSSGRERIGSVRDDSVDQTSVSGFAGLRWALSDALTATVGGRIDHFRWDVDSALPANAGSGHDTLVSPKATLAWRWSDNLETYVNYGRGMHSNDVRGATTRIDPVSGDALEPLDVLIPSDGAELGLRFEQGSAFNVTVAAFWLELESELVFVGDAGGTEAKPGSERRGIETTAFWQITPWLSMHGSYTWTEARHPDEPADLRHIPGAIKTSASAGLNAQWDNGISASVRIRHLGKAPLTENGSVDADPSTLVNAGIVWRRGTIEYRLDAFNLFDSKDQDIAYYYASRLPGEPDEGVEDIHFHPLEPRSIRAAIRVYL